MTEADRPSGSCREARSAPRRRRRAVSGVRWAWEWLKSLVIAFVLFLLIRTFAIEAFRIPTASMERTLLVGDFLLVNKAAYGAQVPGTGMRLPALGVPERGDVVIFTPPHEPDKHYVKRLLGLPGDTLAMRDQVLLRNGRMVAEPYVQHEAQPDVHVPAMDWQLDFLVDGRRSEGRPTRDNWGPLAVPEDRYFVLGDNRDDSEDSRYWGFVAGASLKGKPLFVYYSYDPVTVERVPWVTQIRWDRIGGIID